MQVFSPEPAPKIEPVHEIDGVPLLIVPPEGVAARAGDGASAHAPSSATVIVRVVNERTDSPGCEPRVVLNLRIVSSWSGRGLERAPLVRSRTCPHSRGSDSRRRGLRTT